MSRILRHGLGPGKGIMNELINNQELRIKTLKEVLAEPGAYLGTLEVTQELTQLRALKGERRLRQYV